MYRWASRVSLLVAVVALGIAAYLWSPYGRSAAPEPFARIENPDEVVEGLPVGGRADVRFRITNTGRQPIRVLSMSGECSQCACLMPKRNEELVIAPGATAIWEGEVSAHHAGAIVSGATLFLDDGGLRSVRLTVRGTVVPAEVPAHAKP